MGPGRGQFEQFHNNLCDIRLTSEAASADMQVAEDFPSVLKQIIEGGGYNARQVFNAESGLFWKRMQSRTYISQEERQAPGFKAAKHWVTVLLAGDAAGDCKTKPLVVHTFETPWAFKGYIKNHLPILWRSNKSAWITSSLFHEWRSVYVLSAWKEHRAKRAQS